jgi:hypothetical protein
MLNILCCFLHWAVREALSLSKSFPPSPGVSSSRPEFKAGSSVTSVEEWWLFPYTIWTLGMGIVEVLRQARQGHKALILNSIHQDQEFETLSYLQGRCGFVTILFSFLSYTGGVHGELVYFKVMTMFATSKERGGLTTEPLAPSPKLSTCAIRASHASAALLYEFSCQVSLLV